MSPVLAPCRSKCCAQSPDDEQVWLGDMGCRICLFCKDFDIQQATREGRQAQRKSKAAQGLHRAAADYMGGTLTHHATMGISTRGVRVGAVRVPTAVTRLTVYRWPQVVTCSRTYYQNFIRLLWDTLDTPRKVSPEARDIPRHGSGA